MDILVNVVNQKLKVATNLKQYVDGTQKFIRFVFNLGNEWDGLKVFAQFQQDKAYNVYLDEDNGAYLPPEIKEGTCTLMLYGSSGDVIGTTNYLTLKIDPNMLVSDAESTEISESLYNQMVLEFNEIKNEFNNIKDEITAATVIEEGSITEDKLSEDLRSSLQDISNLKASIAGIQEEIRDARILTDDNRYNSVGDSIRGALHLSKEYANSVVSNSGSGDNSGGDSEGGSGSDTGNGSTDERVSLLEQELKEITLALEELAANSEETI